MMTTAEPRGAKSVRGALPGGGHDIGESIVEVNAAGNCLHGGRNGFDKRLWDAKPLCQCAGLHGPLLRPRRSRRNHSLGLASPLGPRVGSGYPRLEVVLDACVDLVAVAP